MKALEIQHNFTDGGGGQYMAQLRRFRVLTPDEETEIAMLAHQGCKASRTKLVEHNLRFAFSVAKQYANNQDYFYDVLQESNAGLVEAAERFDPTKGFKFISYAVWYMRKNIIEYLSTKTRIVRITRDNYTEIDKQEKEEHRFFAQNGYMQTTIRLQKPKSISLDTPKAEDDTDPLSNFFRAEDNTQQAIETANQVDYLLSHLTPLERELVTRYYGYNRMQETAYEIGHRFGIDTNAVAPKIKKLLKKLRRYEEVY